jgi:hypothetical protein
MNEKSKIVNIFWMPLQYPCGPNSACCGPIGQSEEDIKKLKSGIEEKTGLSVEVINSMDGTVMKNHLQIVRLLRSFGPTALPLIAIGDDVVSMGAPSLEEVVPLIQGKIGG